MWLLRDNRWSRPSVRFLAMLPQGVLWSHYGVMLAEKSCRGQTTPYNCTLQANKALGTPLQLYGHLVTARQPFKLPIGLIFGHYLATGGVEEPLWCDSCREVMPLTNHSVVLPFESIKSIRNTSAVVWSCGYCATAFQVAHRLSFSWPFGHRGVMEPLRCDTCRVVMP